MQKRVLAVHDISCVGKCSLTVALPILSAAGLETSILPTAVLSTHTGGFSGFTYRDLTEDIEPIVNHWKSLDLQMDAIYTGYLGSFRQIDLVSSLFDSFKTKNNIILIDPVMADNGVLYSLFTPEFARGMAKLCAKADIVIPNLTEAAFILEEPYVEGPYTKEYIESLLKKLSDIGPKKVVLTGVYFEKGKLGAATYDRDSGNFSYYFAEEIEGYFHGTGDVFGSALLAALMQGLSLVEASHVAVDFTVGSIKRTKQAKTEARYGVDFENELPNLIKAIKK